MVNPPTGNARRASMRQPDGKRAPLAASQKWLVLKRPAGVDPIFHWLLPPTRKEGYLIIIGRAPRHQCGAAWTEAAKEIFGVAVACRVSVSVPPSFLLPVPSPMLAKGSHYSIEKVRILKATSFFKMRSFLLLLTCFYSSCLPKRNVWGNKDSSVLELKVNI